MSAGGNTCGNSKNEECDPDFCYYRDDCPDYPGYWCKGAGNTKLM